MNEKKIEDFLEGLGFKFEKLADRFDVWMNKMWKNLWFRNMARIVNVIVGMKLLIIAGELRENQILFFLLFAGCGGLLILWQIFDICFLHKKS